MHVFKLCINIFEGVYIRGCQSHVRVEQARTLMVWCYQPNTNPFHVEFLMVGFEYDHTRESGLQEPFLSCTKCLLRVARAQKQLELPTSMEEREEMERKEFEHRTKDAERKRRSRLFEDIPSYSGLQDPFLTRTICLYWLARAPVQLEATASVEEREETERKEFENRTKEAERIRRYR